MIEIVYEDRDVIVVLKPVGMPCQKDPSGDEDVYSVVHGYLSEKDEGQTLGLHQRLDRPVGGLMVLSKSKEASKGLSDQMEAKTIDKWYLALVEGTPEEETSLKHYIKKVRGNRSVVSGKKVAGSKEALLTYKRLKHSGERCLLEVKLETGRHHQIRAQLAHVKLPLVGDTKYNLSYSGKRGWFDIGLYAYKLSFKHPVTGEKLMFEQWPEHEPFNYGK